MNIDNQTSDFTAMSRGRFLAPAIGIMFIAVISRSVHLAHLSLWSDELFSRYYASLFGLKYLWSTGLTHEDTPPIYYVVLQGWMWLFGDSEIAMRSLSVVASTLAVPLVYLLGAELWDARRGLFAAAVLAIAPMQVSFAQDARSYALLLLPVGSVLLAIARILRGDTGRLTLLLYAGAAIVAIYCHATAVFFIAACNMVVLAYLLATRSPALRSWIVLNALVAVAAIPELIGMFVQGRTGSGITWIPPFGPLDVVRSFSAVVSGVTTPTKFPGAELSFAVLLSVAAAILIAPPDRRAAAVTIAIPATFTVLIGLLSVLRSIFIARVFCWIDLPLALLIAHAIASAPRARIAVLATVVVTMVTGLGYQVWYAKNEPWRSLLHEITPDLARADLVVLAPLTDPTAFAYYAPKIAPLETWNVGLHDSVENVYMPRRMGVRVLSPEQIIESVRRRQDVWLIMRTPDLPYVKPLLDQLPPPRVNIERTCGAKIMCLAAMAW